MKKVLALALAGMLSLAVLPVCAENVKTGMIEESFTIDCKVMKTTGEAAFDAPVQISVALPANYYESEDPYAVCYVLDGSRYVSAEADAGGLFHMYETSPQSMPNIIYVGVNHPEGSYRSAVYGAPFDTSFFVCDHNRAVLDQQLQGTGDYFFGWMADTLKPYVDSHYRTLTDAENTGVVGYSSGGSGAMIAAILHGDVFGKVGAFSPATWLWSNWMYGVITNSGYHYTYTTADGAERDYTASVEGIKRLFVYQGGNDGSAGDPDWAFHDVENIYRLMTQKGAGSDGHRFVSYQEGIHDASSWRLFNAQCMRMLFSEYVADMNTL